MPKRGAMFPTSLWGDDEFKKLSPDEQLLLVKVWLSPNLDSAGIHPLQISKWSRGFTPRATEAQMRDVVVGLEAKNWAVADFDTEELFVRPFIRLDASKQPQIYTAACRAIQAAQSPALQRAAWEQVMIVHPPKLKTDPEKSPETYRRLERMQTAAFEELREFMAGQTEGLPQGSRTLPEGSGVGVGVGVGESEGEEEGEGEGSGDVPHNGSPLLCANGCDAGAGPDGYCDACVKARKW